MLYLVHIYVIIFLVFTGIHLYASYIKRDALRAPTKTILLLPILGMYLEWMHLHNAIPSVFLVFALLTSWVGDILLVPKGTMWFTMGGVSFEISHFLFILAYIASGIVFSQIHPVFLIGLPLVYATVATVLFMKMKGFLPSKLRAPIYLYLLINGAMNVFAWFRLLSGSCTPLSGCITGLGALLFFISDCALFFVRFDKNCKLQSHFLVMLTYTAGEFLIVLGFMLLAAG